MSDKKNILCNVLFCIALGIYYVFKYFLHDDIFVMFVCFILIIKFLIEGPDLIYCIKVVGIMMFAVLIFLNNNMSNVIISFLFLAVSKDIDLKKFFKTDLFFRIIMFLSKVVPAILGITNSGRFVVFQEGVYRERYSLGFEHPNVLGINLFNIFVLAVLVYREKLKAYHYIGLLVINYFFYSYTDSRTSFWLSNLFLILCFVFKYKSMYFILENKINKFLAVNSYICLAAASLFFSYRVFDFPILLRSETFATRLMSAYQIMVMLKLKLFGQTGTGIIKSYFDQGYVFSLYFYGILLFAVTLGGLTVLLKRIYKFELRYEVIALVCFALYCVLENIFLEMTKFSIEFLFIFIIFPNKMKEYTDSFNDNSCNKIKSDLQD